MGVGLTIPRRKKIFLRNLKEMKLDGYIGKDMKENTKVCG